MAKAVSKVVEESSALDNSDYDDYAGAGMENVTGRDLIIPRVTILQALSPQLNKAKAEFIKGAQIGEIYDLGINKRIGEEILFLPVYFSRRWLEWHPRASGKGLARIHDSDRILKDCSPNEKGMPVTQDGNLIQETAQFFGLNLSMERRKCFIPLQSTQLKKARRWLSMAANIKLPNGRPAPLFYSSYKLGTISEQNNEGNWVGWTIEQAEILPSFSNEKEILGEAAEFLRSLRAGEAKADDSGVESDPKEDGEF